MNKDFEDSLQEMMFYYKDIELMELTPNGEKRAKVTVQWTDRNELDYGYCFQLPNQDVDKDMLDFFIHMNEIDNSDGIGKADEEWIHLKNLLTLERVKTVTFW